MDAVQNLNPRKSSEAISHSQLHQRILDATVQLFVEAGYSNVTTNLIAQRAGVSVGSIYRFYPNKFAIFNALVENWFREMDHTIDQFIATADATKPWEEQLDQLAERMASMWRQGSGFILAWGVLTGNPEVEKSDITFATHFFTRIAGYLPAVAPGHTHAEYAAAARILYWTALTTLDTAIHYSADYSEDYTGDGKGFDQSLFDQGKAMLKAYIRQFAASPSRVPEPDQPPATS